MWTKTSCPLPYCCCDSDSSVGGGSGVFDKAVLLVQHLNPTAAASVVVGVHVEPHQQISSLTVKTSSVVRNIASSRQT